MKNDIERRVIGATVEIRADEGSEPVIVGYAAVYDAESNDLGGFTEIIEPGFFDLALSDDVRALWNHNSDIVLGRTVAKTLELSSDEHGLLTEIQPPDTQAGRDAITSIKRGDVDQMSFAFTVAADGDEWQRSENGRPLRILKRDGCAKLYDVSPVTYPAYEQTRVAARALDHVNELRQAAQDDNSAQEKQRRAALDNRKRELEIKKLR